MDARTSNFSRIARQYDATRNVPSEILARCYDRLSGEGFLPRNGRILDVGCGTGQMSIPLAERGGSVHGIDISRDMIEIARSKVKPGWEATFATGDARDLQAGDDNFDCAIVSKLFQHIEEWRKACREIIRVVRPGGHIIHINERGAFGNAVRRHFTARANELGFAKRYLGLDPHTRVELTEFLMAQRCRTERIDISDLRWETSISYGAALDQIAEGLFAEFWYLPQHIHLRLIAETAAWVSAQAGGADRIDRLSPYLAIEVFTVPEAS